MSIDFEMCITDIKKAKKHCKAVYVDGEFFAFIDSDIVFNQGLNKGKTLTGSKLEDIKNISDRKRAKEKALYFLEYRDYSKKDMKNKLMSEYPEDIVDATLEKLEELELIDDNKFAKRYINKLINSKGFAPRRILYEVSLKGLDTSTAEEIIENLNVDFSEKLKEFIIKNINLDCTDEKKEKRIFSRLQRMGYNYEDIKSVFDELMSSREVDI